jgi:Ni2+-binding GTPase involved in maturation of urease and hydrogenase
MTASLAERPWVVLVGGFLGAGKTTLIVAAARELERRGVKCAVILNDQGEDLVDTQYAAMHGLTAGEVTGGCFCCRLSDLVGAMDRMRSHEPQVIFAEPVGSCTDLSATVFHPLNDNAASYRLAPLTVLVDPTRAESVSRGESAVDVAFLFSKQVEEADLICITKADVHPEIDRSLFPGRQVRQLSAVTGQGVAAWLDEVLSGALPRGGTTLDIDYDRYAAAEAALAWMNLRAIFRPRRAMPPALVLGPVMDGIEASLREEGLAVVHLKGLVESPTGHIKAAYTAPGEGMVVEGDLTASPAPEHELRINVRALGEPERLHRIVEQHVRRLEGELHELRLQAFRPSPPQPERRVVRAP